MFICMIISGLIGAFFLKSVFGFVLGLILGPFIYRFLNQKAPIRNKEVDEKREALFLEVLFESFGAVCKAKGRITESDIQFITEKMRQRNFSAARRELAQSAFNRGKEADYPLTQRIDLLYSQFRTQQNVLSFFCEQIISTAMHDGDLTQNELNVILIITDHLRLSRQRVLNYIELMRAQNQHSYRYSHSSYQQHSYQNNSYQQNYSRATQQNELEKAYQTLGVKPTDDPQTIKRAYRKLMNEYHPDKLMSKGLPKEMLESAKKRAQEIQASYDLIKTDRQFK